MTEEEVVLERLKLIACGGVPAGVVAETLSRVISFCHKKGKGDAGKKLLYCCLDTLTKIWRSCVRDMNDIRLYQELVMLLCADIRILSLHMKMCCGLRMWHLLRSGKETEFTIVTG